MVPRAGLEPAHPKARDFKSLVSTDFTIWADGFFLPPIFMLNFHSTLKSKLWRLEPESNRRQRICNPRHNHFAIQPRRHILAGDLKKTRDSLSKIVQKNNLRTRIALNREQHAVLYVPNFELIGVFHGNVARWSCACRTN